MKYNYCTLFDSGYMSRGILMYNSLMKYSKDAFLYVFAFDDFCYKILKNMRLPRMKVISLTEFENKRLLEAKKNRTRAEYCWTCSSSSVLYVLENFDVDNCTYVDADMIFLSDSSVLIKEMGNKSVLLTKHRPSLLEEKPTPQGRYCVQFMTFKKDKNGLKALRWWADKCIEGCYARLEPGRFGDQKYLDDWTERFKGIHVSKNLGGGVAPWNVKDYEFKLSKNDIYVKRKNSKEGWEKVVFFHYHQLETYKHNIFDFGGYKLNKLVIKEIYFPIIRNLKNINTQLKTLGIKNPEPLSKLSFRKIIRAIVRKIQGRSNIYKARELD